MSGRHPKSMRPRDESAHGVIQDALDKGYLGTDAVYPVDGFTSHDAANEGRLSINRGSKHLNVSAACWVVDSDGQHCPGHCKSPDSAHGLRFRLWSKDSARSHVLASTGGDPSKLRYNPFQRRSGPAFDDAGRPL